MAAFGGIAVRRVATRRNLARQFLSLATAYLFACQVLLAGILGAQSAATALPQGSDSPFTICYGNHSGPSQQGPAAPAHDLQCYWHCLQAFSVHALLSGTQAALIEPQNPTLTSFAALVAAVVNGKPQTPRL